MPQTPVVDSPIPAVLLRSPRTAHRKPGTLGPLLLGRILTAPVLAVCAALLAAAILDLLVVLILPAQPAHVIRRWQNFQPHRGTMDDIEYQFDRTGFVGRDEVLPEEYEAFRVGQAVRAHVIRLGPLSYSALDRSWGAYVRYRKILWFGAAFASAIGGVLFYGLWLIPWRARWLTRYGKATFGAVLEKSIIHRGRRHFYFTLTYQFKAHGYLYARRINISPQRYDSSGIKDLVVILFDPARPRRNIVYDYCDFVAS